MTHSEWIMEYCMFVIREKMYVCYFQRKKMSPMCGVLECVQSKTKTLNPCKFRVGLYL